MKEHLGVYFVGLLNNRIRIVLAGVSLFIFILMTMALIMAVPGKGYCISPSPVISADPVLNVATGTNITVSGQNFTPNGIAVLYSTGYPESYTAKVDKNGNITWLITQARIVPYQIYALDENSTSRRSNAITIYSLNDATYTPSSIPSASIEMPIVSDMPTPPSPAFQTGDGGPQLVSYMRLNINWGTVEEKIGMILL